MTEWVIAFIQSHGLPAVALLMFLENVFPPLPSELIMPFAGFAAAKGNMNIVLVALAGALGSVAGAVPWYWVGHRFGVARVQKWAADHGTYLAMSSDFFLGDRFEHATRGLDIATKVILACLVAVYVWRVVKLRRSRA